MIRNIEINFLQQTFTESPLHAGQDPESQSHRGKVGATVARGHQGFGRSLAQVLGTGAGQEGAAWYLGEGGAR